MCHRGFWVLKLGWMVRSSARLRQVLNTCTRHLIEYRIIEIPVRSTSTRFLARAPLGHLLVVSFPGTLVCGMEFWAITSHHWFLPSQHLHPLWRLSQT